MTNKLHFQPYHSHLLRMWVESTGRRSPVWRFSLQDVDTGQRAGFADLDELICHLLALMERSAAIAPEERRFPPAQELV